MATKHQSEEASHKEYLQFQVVLELSVKKMHKTLYDKVVSILDRNTNADGTIDKWKLNKIVDEFVGNEVNVFKRGFKKQMIEGIIASAEKGMHTTIQAVKPKAKITADVWQTVVTMAKNRVVNVSKIDGLSLSERVWKIGVDVQHELNKMISSGILQGNSAASISRNIRGYLLQPETLRGAVKDALHPGRGVYKSAYKNAMRVTRTETNRAYINAQKDTAKKLGANMQFALSKAHDVEDICDDYDGLVFSPDMFPAPVHPQCMCFALTVYESPS